ncbi:hypothetical protein EW093_15835 [Thiospirochaeta perfilievii]|uniref:Uncharacterized protein n=1 Tax=Thiospirochaeta perfilievii TaxID=252967 RepID=A0A5C1QIU3_9SPIO|nr:hypothetical protein [Thiospirochaeta perfilievii]QEN06092.1 hypothetical protein EW093_15835 [Thiospirochaeta perfilievii]
MKKKAVKYKLSVKKDFSSDLVEELRHIDKYFSKYINANVEIIVTELQGDHNEDFIVELNDIKVDDPTISNIVDIANKEAMLN